MWMCVENTIHEKHILCGQPMVHVTKLNLGLFLSLPSGAYMGCPHRGFITRSVLTSPSQISFNTWTCL